MNTSLFFTIFLVYFVVLVAISYIVSRKSGADAYYTGDRQSPWPLVAYGMIGAAMSGVTFVSIPGMVSNNYLYYFQFVIGNVIGYSFIVFVLIPIYYKFKLISIYTYLSTRFGFYSYKTGSLLFIISQSFGAALRLLLAVKVLDYAMFAPIGIPFPITVLIILILIWVYTNKSGIKTIVWTDTLQTTFLIVAAIVSIFAIKNALNFSISETIDTVTSHKYFKVFDWDSKSGNNFFKQIVSGILIAIAMMGLDQNIMQKTLTCKSKSEAQKNALVFSFILAITQFLFLGLGILLYVFAENKGITLPIKEGTFINTDDLFPKLSLNYFGIAAAITFILGITAAAFSSVDSALTALTTSFTHDFLNIDKKTPTERKKAKNLTLFGFNIIVFAIIMAFANSTGDIITSIFKVAGYTYGPLLGLFLFGIFSKVNIIDKLVPFICIIAPVLTYILNYVLIYYYSFDLGFMNIFINALITIVFLILIKPKHESAINH
ncbi:Na+/proline symporter [Galbibacter orientalis DSM 19592]|uniref:Na+/proline symporter n=1 Tax=Galbibacter orientalis DSM 19592 TaxID=926559 RepID=I3C7I2_9FLAO|nr:sodium:solute symporter [Galbibacter orientalis]EIJ39575.1 Na+/proline symporter [Galbibacter orientalis DSM 19592]